MTNKTGNSQQIYSSKDVATLLQIQESTLRKYCILLEEHKYHFHKNEQGRRGFYDKDVITLKKLIEIKSHPDMTLKQACDAVMTWVNTNDVTDTDTAVTTENEQHDARYDELKSMIEQQNELLRQMAVKMDGQQRYIEESLNRRDQLLLESIRDMQEEKRALIEAAAAQKRPWWQFWKK
ncbi:DNA-binding protein [Bacillus manliponensis]|uniref:DNA-binding protein n=1 Tax=Bacillus manliponensis TaxID=574376 RepID=A0A073K4W4_9BACI|nr:DUF3967 domain-containing protein [Bacillus manliponensis]KEK17318.1 DNA-binding protein [Bacillus manliponensis]